MDARYEFFSPFAHVPGRYEWCRVQSPTHGVFDAFIMLGPSTADPATVYVHEDNGAAFMADRYPECTAVRVAQGRLMVAESADGRRVRGWLEADAGPVRRAAMDLVAAPGARPRDEPYGGTGRPVWGGRWACWGVDLVLDGHARGHVLHAGGREERIDGPAIVTLGSFGRITPLDA